MHSIVHITHCKAGRRHRRASGIVSDLPPAPKCGISHGIMHTEAFGHATVRSGYTNSTPDYEVISVEPETGKFVVMSTGHEGALQHTSAAQQLPIVNLC